MPGAMTKPRDDRGAILVHVAFALLALMAFSSFSPSTTA